MCFVSDCAGVLADAYGFKFSDFFCFLSMFPDNWLRFNDTYVLFLRLSDVHFNSLKCGDLDFRDPKSFFPLFSDCGDHVHILGVVSSSVSDMLFLRRFLFRRSLSWFRPDMSKLVVFERS